MVFGFGGKKPKTVADESPNTKYKFTWCEVRITESELQQHVEDKLTFYVGQNRPEWIDTPFKRADYCLHCAREFLHMFTEDEDVKVLANSPRVQSVMFDREPILFCLKEAIKHMEKVTQPRELQHLKDQYKDADGRYRDLLDRLETQFIYNEDPNCTKKYKFSFGTMQGSALQQKMEDVLTKYGKSNDSPQSKMEGAEVIMDMFASPQDRKLLNESLAVQSTVLGRCSKQGPIGFLLERAEEGLRGTTDKAPLAKLERLKARHESMQSEARGRKAIITPKPAGFSIRTLMDDRLNDDGHEGR